MTHLLNLVLSLLLLILQTALLPHFSLFSGLYDLCLLFVIYYGLLRSRQESIVVVLFLGLGMDGVTGGPYGLYLTSYFWLWVGIQMMVRYIHAGNRLMHPFILALAILLQNLLHLGLIVLLQPRLTLPEGQLRTVGIQMLWGLLTAPPLIAVLYRTHKRWEGWWRTLALTKTHSSMP